LAVNRKSFAFLIKQTATVKESKSKNCGKTFQCFYPSEPILLARFLPHSRPRIQH